MKLPRVRFKSGLSNSGKFASPEVNNSIWGDLGLLPGQIQVGCLAGLLVLVLLYI